jgi:hypothetical protein
MRTPYILTSDGSKSLYDAIHHKDSISVYAVDSELRAHPTKVSDWKHVPTSTHHYELKNRDSKFMMWFSDAHSFYVVNNNNVEIVTGAYYNEYYRTIYNRLRIPVYFQLIRNSDTKPLDPSTINRMVQRQVISTSFIDGNAQDASQLIFAWNQAYGGLYARNYNSMMMLQAIVTSTGVCSHVVRDNGFRVIPHSGTTITVDSFSNASDQRIDQIPLDINRNQLHLIYNIDNFVFLL